MDTSKNFKFQSAPIQENGQPARPFENGSPGRKRPLIRNGTNASEISEEASFRPPPQLRDFALSEELDRSKTSVFVGLFGSTL